MIRIPDRFRLNAAITKEPGSLLETNLLFEIFLRRKSAFPGVILLSF